MGLFDSIGNFFDTAVSDVTGLFSSAGDVSNVGGLSVPGAPVPVTYSYSGFPPSMPGAYPQATPTMEVAGPVMQSLVRASGLPKWSALLPSLWQYVITTFPRVAPSRAVAGLLALMRKYGPTALVSMLGAAVVNELMQYTVIKKRRRMNVANSRALRRSMRRLKGFERLSHRVSAQLSRAAGRSGRRRRSSACPTCHKVACIC